MYLLAGIMHHVLVALAVLGGYILLILVAPRKRCRRCNGWGVRQKRRGRSACTKCRGTGKNFRPGARLAHRGAVMAIRYVRERREGSRSPAPTFRGPRTSGEGDPL